MSKKRRSMFLGVFRMCGERWTIRRYFRNGKWRYCHAPERQGGEIVPIFADAVLDRNAIREIIQARRKKCNNAAGFHKSPQ